MKLVELKHDDERFGHKAGDLFMVEDADYDGDKYVGVKVVIQKLDNSFYKTQMKNAPAHKLKIAAEKIGGQYDQT